MSKIRVRQKKFIFAGLVGAVAMLIICLIAGLLGYNALSNNQKDERITYEKELLAAQEQLKKTQTEQQEIFAFKADMPAGTVIKTEDLYRVAYPKSAVPADYADLQMAVGKITKISVIKNTPILKSMYFEEEKTPNDLRDQEFKVIELPTKTKASDYVDVRIKFPTGQDYIVLSKKKVDDRLGNMVWYKMDEKEILMMSSAIVDAYINDATIYALNYSDPYMQEAAIVNYPPNEKVTNLIKSDPNIIEKAKKELEVRRRTVLETDLASMDPAARDKYNSRNSGISTNPAVNNTTNENSPSNYPTIKDETPVDPTNGKETSVPETQAEIAQPDTQTNTSKAPTENKIYGETPNNSVSP